MKLSDYMKILNSSKTWEELQERLEEKKAETVKRFEIWEVVR